MCNIYPNQKKLKMTQFDLRIKSLSPAIGAEISGVDLSEKLDCLTIESIRRALLDYGVIFFRNQNLSPQKKN